MMPTTMVALMVVLFALGVPIAVAIGLAALAGVSWFTSMPLLVVAQQLYIAIDSWPLIAVPFFILAARLMEAGGRTQALVHLAQSVMGTLPGALGGACVLASMIFAAISGSSVATTFAVGAILIPALTAQGYPKPYAASLQATAAELGVVLPPSIPLILYGVSTDTSVPRLFAAGLGPGLLIGAALFLYTLVIGRRRGYGAVGVAASNPPFRQSLRAAWPSLCMPIVVLGGIYGGWMTPTEAAVVAVAYAFCLAVVALGWRGFGAIYRAFRRAVVDSSVIMLIIACAGAFNFLLTRAGVPSALGAWIAGQMNDPVLFLVFVNIVLFGIGMFIETAAAILVLAPILAPVAIAMGIDAVQFGVIMVVNLALGMVTPPFGVNLFAVCRVTGLSPLAVVPALLPFVLLVLGCLVLITFVPAITLGPVGLLM